jgi:hypothetical protein
MNMNVHKNYNVVSASAVKHTITITRYELWKNFFSSWSDIVMDSPTENDLTHFQCVAKILCVGELDHNICKLFRQGDTCMLMGDAMQYIDTGDKNTLVEIVVTDGDKSVIVYMSDITY